MALNTLVARCIVLLFGSELLAVGASSQIVSADFENGDLAGGLVTMSAGGDPVITGAEGLRITSLTESNNNAIAWPAFELGCETVLRLRFDFKMTDDEANAAAGGCCDSAADGLGFGFFSTNTYPATGAFNPASNNGAPWENPAELEGFVDAIAVGLAIFKENRVRITGPGGPQNLLADAEPEFY